MMKVHVEADAAIGGDQTMIAWIKSLAKAMVMVPYPLDRGKLCLVR